MVNPDVEVAVPPRTSTVPGPTCQTRAYKQPGVGHTIGSQAAVSTQHARGTKQSAAALRVQGRYRAGEKARVIGPKMTSKLPCPVARYGLGVALRERIEITIGLPR